MQVTLKEIAAKTGLSVSVVSRALNPRPDKNARVSEKTRELVSAAASRLGFRPNRAAQSLKRGKSPAIGVFLPEFANRLIADLVMGLSEPAAEAGVPISFHFGLTLESYEAFFRQVSAEAHSGIISYTYSLLKDEAVARRIKDYHKKGGAVLLLNSEHQFQGIPVVSIDDRFGAILAARRLISRSCDAFVSFPPFSLRSDAFRDAIRGEGHESHQAGSCAEVPMLCAKLRTGGRRKIGIFATTDRDALELIPVLRREGWSIGRDALIVGFDDLCLCDVCDPPLTTIHQPFREEGRIAIRKLLRMLEGHSEESVFIEPSLIVRASA